MMCGLPASGKTHWVTNWIEKNPEKRYTVIGNTQLLEKMTVSFYIYRQSYMHVQECKILEPIFLGEFPLINENKRGCKMKNISKYLLGTFTHYQNKCAQIFANFLR